MKYNKINPALFKDNRKRFAKAQSKNSIAIIAPNPVITENADAVYNYKANSDLYWLTGISQKETYYISFPDNPNKDEREILVILTPNEHLEKWEGHKLTPAEAADISGISTVIHVEQLEATLKRLIHIADTIYINSNENDRLSQNSLRTDTPFIQNIQKQYPLHQYARASRITKDLRQIKNKYEVEVIKQAIDITRKTYDKVLKTLTPGMTEYELEGLVMQEFLSNRATRNAYGVILASGANACILHYIDNNQVCQDGDLILMDFGAEYGGYTSDMTRTIPVNGKFTKRQKEVYNACLAVHNFAKKYLKNGVDFDAYNKAVNQEMEKQLIKLGLLTKNDIKNQDPKNPAYRQFYYHGLSHHMGIDVHDLGWLKGKVKTGMVLTVEPGIYIAEEGIGVRIENDVVVTPSGIKDLFTGFPITVAEIEKAMSRKK